MTRKHLYEWMIPNEYLGLPPEKPPMNLEQRIAEIIYTSELECCIWPYDQRMKLAQEIVDGLEHHGWKIEHESYGSTD